MKLNSHKTRTGLVAGIGVVVLALLLPSTVLAHTGEGGAPKNSINGLFDITFWIALPIFILVEGLILFAIYRYRRHSKSEMPEQVEGNRPLEISWTVLSFVIVTVLFILTLRALQTDYKAKAENGSTAPFMTVQVDAYLFNWDYTYFLGEDEATGLVTTHTLTIPAQRNVYLKIDSKDVQHSFWVPDLAGKVDAIPGRTNTMWLNVDKPGKYLGNCAEYCGALHYAMTIEVDVLAPAEFDAWMAGQMSAMGQFVAIDTDLQSPLPPGDAARGEQQFAELGCNACHQPDEGIGPALPYIAQDAGSHDGYTAESFLRESILLPCDYETPGFNCQIMSPDYGHKLDAQGLSDIIQYLLTYNGPGESDSHSELAD
jgi:cytochrome c oxidase subunit II